MDLTRRPAVRGASWSLAETSGGGEWCWQDGDFADRVRADPLGGLTIAHAEVPASRGAWARLWDGVAGRPEWFGARADDAGFDNRASIQAALDLCATVQLGPGTYYLRHGLRILRSGTSLLGAGHTQTDQGPNHNSTRLLCSDAAATIVQIGSDSATPPPKLVEAVRLEGFSVDRSVDPFTPASGVGGSVGVALRWCVNCHAERVFSLNSARGWLFYGTVENYVRYCGALRGRGGSNRANDVFVGFHIDQDAPSGYNGGNASLYLTYCRVFPSIVGASPSLGYSAGVRFDGGWVDCFLHGLETGGGIQYGIHGFGDGTASTSPRTENLIVTNCILDPGSVACISLERGGGVTAVTIANNYLGTLAGVGLRLSRLGGSITVQGNQFMAGAAQATGVRADAVNGLRAQGNIFTGHREPVAISRCTNFHLGDTINGRFGGGDHSAIVLRDCDRGTIDCALSGVASYAHAVSLEGSGNAHVEVRCSGLDPAAISGSGSKLAANGTPVVRAGPFGRDCLASGVMS